jgi:hypothetical protein
VVVCEREDLNSVLIHFRSHSIRKQDRFASGQNLRACEGLFSVSQFRDYLGRAATGRKPQKALGVGLARDDAAILTPACAG